MSHLRFYLPFAVVLLLLSEPPEGQKIWGFHYCQLFYFCTSSLLLYISAKYEGGGILPAPLAVHQQTQNCGGVGGAMAAAKGTTTPRCDHIRSIAMIGPTPLVQLNKCAWFQMSFDFFGEFLGIPMKNIGAMISKQIGCLRQLLSQMNKWHILSV